MGRTVLVSSAMALVYLGSIGHFSACGQIGGSAPGTRPSSPGSTAPGSTLPRTPGASSGSRLGSGAPGGSTGPASGGAFVPPSDTPPTTIPPPTTPPPVRAPGSLGDSTIPGTATTPDGGTPPRFGTPPATGGAIPPSTLPGRESSTLDDPAFAPLESTPPGGRFNPATDPLDDSGARPAESGAMPAEDERLLPGDPGYGRNAPGTLAPPAPGAEAGPADRRLAKMIYRNELATFYLVLDQGAAHYHLQHQGGQQLLKPQTCFDGHCLQGSIAMPSYAPHLASLQLEESTDANYWHYTAQDGDQFTVEWAFARRPSRDGGYAVYRQTRDGWARYGSFSRQALR